MRRSDPECPVRGTEQHERTAKCCDNAGGGSGRCTWAVAVGPPIRRGGLPFVLPPGLDDLPWRSYILHDVAFEIRENGQPINDIDAFKGVKILLDIY